MDGNVQRDTNKLVRSVERKKQCPSAIKRKRKRTLGSPDLGVRGACGFQVLDETDMAVPDQGVLVRSRIGTANWPTAERRREKERLKLQLQAIKIKQRLLELENESEDKFL